MSIGNLRIITRLAIGFGLILVVFTGLAIWAIVEMQSLASLTEKLYRHPLTVSNAVLEADADIIAMHRGMKDVALASSPAAIDAAVRKVDDFEREIIDGFTLIEERFLGDKRQVTDALQAIRDWRAIRAEVIALMKAGRRDEAAEITRGRGARHVALINERMSGLITFAKTKADSFHTMATARRDSAMWVMTLLQIFGILLAGVTAWAITRSICRPLGALETAMGRLSAGDLETEIPYADNQSEIGDMARSVGVFKDQMNRAEQLNSERARTQATLSKRTEAVEQLSQAFDQEAVGIIEAVAGAAEQLEGTARTLTGTMDNTAERAVAISAASEEASANVQTVASASEELSISIGEIARQVTESNRIAADAVETAEKTDTTVRGLVEAAQQIGEVVDLINNIAAQTNLLALNATIEAARAGDAGKGFAVVASEVKNLANQTAKATDKISQQISAIQQVSESAAESISGIGNVIREINSITAGIASAVEQQGAATEEISRNVQQAANGTKEVSSNILEISDATKSAGSRTKEVLTAAGDLSERSDNLRQIVSRFLEDMRGQRAEVAA